eukprot:10057984-Alexandrium_andersonii.AAC.1
MACKTRRRVQAAADLRANVRTEGIAARFADPSNHPQSAGRLRRAGRGRRRAAGGRFGRQGVKRALKATS